MLSPYVESPSRWLGRPFQFVMTAELFGNPLVAFVQPLCDRNGTPAADGTPPARPERGQNQRPRRGQHRRERPRDCVGRPSVFAEQPCECVEQLCLRVKRLYAQA
jgi:hypothetical protein